MLISANSLVEHLNRDATKQGAKEPPKPFDITEYQATLQEASNAVIQIHQLLKTVNQMGLNKALPILMETADRMEQKGQKWVLQAFVLGILFILILLKGAVAVMLFYRRMAQRMFPA